MLAKLKNSITKDRSDTRQKSFVPRRMEHVLSAGLGDEIRLDQELCAKLASSFRKGDRFGLGRCRLLKDMRTASAPRYLLSI